MANRISCRDSVYGGWQHAVEYLAKAGIKYIELGVSTFDDLRRSADASRAGGVIPLSIAGDVNFDDPASVDRVAAACTVAQEIDVQYYFLSAGGTERTGSMKSLARLGECAAGCGVTLCLETHPPFCLNADEMLKTMSEVNHGSVRINFDTANIKFYNAGIDSADELEKVVSYVASLHLKDTDGGFRSDNFPVFGEGTVQFPRIFKTLHDAGFDGPLTIELEGPVAGLDSAGRYEKVVACMDYLRSIGEA